MKRNGGNFGSSEQPGYQGLIPTLGAWQGKQSYQGGPNMRDLFSLEGKIALVTGGSVGIGAMIAEGFVNFGAKVYIVARREEVLKKKQEELAKIGPCEYLVAD